MPVKPGWKTTEFWLTLFTTIIGAVLAAGLVPKDTALEQALGAAMMVLSQLGYHFNRAAVKSAAGTTSGPTQ